MHSEIWLKRRGRAQALVRQYMDFVWRSLRQLGVEERDCDDGCQRVWLVVARKVEEIDPAKERSYIFSVVVRVASEMRRSARRHCHEELDELQTEARGEGNPEQFCERQRARRLLEDLLAEMSWDGRVVFVMFEIEGFSTREIAELLGISKGTVASRLRLARECFRRGLDRHRLRRSGVRYVGDSGGEHSERRPGQGAGRKPSREVS